MAHEYLLERYRRMVAQRGRVLDKKSKILDFCCGSGEYVRAFREMDYDVYGFEPFDGICPADQPGVFATAGWKNPYAPDGVIPSERTDLRLNWRDLVMPYPDHSFDFVFSTEVMEHISDHESVLRELQRIMKPDGMAVHSFPSRYRLIEPHINVPFGGIVKSYLLYRAWYAIDRKNPWAAAYLSQRPGFPRSKLAGVAIWYARSSLHYLTPRQLHTIGHRHFRHSSFAPELWTAGITPWLYTLTQHVIWVLEQPRPLPAEYAVPALNGKGGDGSQPQ